jgi:hypothetical protein
MERLFSLLATPHDAPSLGPMLARLMAFLFERKPLLANSLLSVAVAVLYYGVTVVREWLFFILVGPGLLGAAYLAY